MTLTSARALATLTEWIDMTPREYLISLGLAKPTRGKFSKEGLAALDAARKKGMTFDEPAHVVKAKERANKPKPVKPVDSTPKSQAPRVDNSNLDPKTVRAWAIANNVPVGKRGRVAPEVYAAYREAHTETEVVKRVDVPLVGKDLRPEAPRLRSFPKFEGTDINGSKITLIDKECCMCCGYSMPWCSNPDGPLTYSRVDVSTPVRLHGVG
jgi:hypothetical protein